MAHFQVSVANAAVYNGSVNEVLRLQVREAPGYVDIRPNTSVTGNYTITAISFQLGRNYLFQENQQLNVGDKIFFKGNPNSGYLIVTRSGTDSAYNLTPQATHLGSWARYQVPEDKYIKTLLALAAYHSIKGSSKEEFQADWKSRNIADDTPTTPLTKDEFLTVNNANSTVRLQGTETQPTDQTLFDQAGMLSTALNTRNAAKMKAQHPADFDITDPKQQIAITNSTANQLFNNYLKDIPSVVQNIEMDTTHNLNTYSTTTIELNAMVDLFQSLLLPEAELAQLTGAVSSFVDSMRQLSMSDSAATLHNAKLVHFISIEPPVGEPALAHLALQKMIYIQFNEATSQWSNACSSGESYSLDTNVFTCNFQLNSDILGSIYQNLREITLKSAVAEVAALLGDAGVPDTAPPLKTDGPSPLGGGFK